MPAFNEDELVQYVEHTIQSFHERRYESLGGLNLQQVLLRKNPYLFKAKHVEVASDLVKSLLDAHLSSQEETLFGSFLEGIAIFVCAKTFHGFKSKRIGIDLEFIRDEIYYIISIKSGTKWANSDQIKRMKTNFETHKNDLVIQDPTRKVIAVNGCCYGKDNNPDNNTFANYPVSASTGSAWIRPSPVT